MKQRDACRSCRMERPGHLEDCPVLQAVRLTAALRIQALERGRDREPDGPREWGPDYWFPSGTGPG